MNQLELLPRQKLGSKSCRLLRSAGFIPGIVSTRTHTIAISVCSKLIKRSAYKRAVRARLRGTPEFVKLTRCQLDPVSFNIQHVEYRQCERALTNTPTRALIFNATNCAAVKSGARFKLLRSKISLVGESSFAPNYIKVDMSEYIIGDDVEVVSLCYKQARFTTTEPRCVLATVR